MRSLRQERTASYSCGIGPRSEFLDIPKRKLLGHSLDLIIPAGLQTRHWEGYHRVMQTGETRYGTEVLRVPAVHKDGRRLSIAFTVALLYSPTQEIQAIAAIIRDETSRWEEERALRKRLAELEAKNK